MASDAGSEAMRVAAGMGLALERTYTAKAFAAAMDARREGRNVVFLQSWAAPQ
jgi:hypothetical protein